MRVVSETLSTRRTVWELSAAHTKLEELQPNAFLTSETFQAFDREWSMRIRIDRSNDEIYVALIGTAITLSNDAVDSKIVADEKKTNLLGCQPEETYRYEITLSDLTETNTLEGSISFTSSKPEIFAEQPWKFLDEVFPSDLAGPVLSIECCLSKPIAIEKKNKLLLQLWQSQDSKDITFQFADESIFAVHKAVIISQNTFFSNLIRNELGSSASLIPIPVIRLETIRNHHVARALFLYMYVGDINTPETEKNVFAHSLETSNLLEVAHVYGVPALAEECVSPLCRHLNADNIPDLFVYVSKHFDSKLKPTTTTPHFAIRLLDAMLDLLVSSKEMLGQTLCNAARLRLDDPIVSKKRKLSPEGEEGPDKKTRN